jgi:hypothetical protein
MTKYTPSLKDLAQLNDLVSLGITDPNSEEIINSSVYQNIQRATHLDLFGSQYIPQALLIMAQIAAQSPTLEIVDMSSCNLYLNGEAIAAVLATSSSIHTVYMNNNNLGEHCLPVARALAQSGSIKKVELMANNLGEHAEQVAKIFHDREHNIETIITLNTPLLPVIVQQVVMGYASLDTELELRQDWIAGNRWLEKSEADVLAAMISDRAMREDRQRQHDEEEQDLLKAIANSLRDASQPDDVRAQGNAGAGHVDARAEPHLEEAWNEAVEGDRGKAQDRRAQEDQRFAEDLKAAIVNSLRDAQQHDDAGALLGNAEAGLWVMNPFSFQYESDVSTPLTGCVLS